MSWELKKLDEIVLVKSGKRLPKGHSFIIKPTDHPYIRARDIKNGKINVEAPVYINNDTFNKISKYTVSENDVVITIVGANVGDIAIIDAKYSGANLTENAAKLIPKNNNELSPKFLKYSLFGDTQKSKFQQIAMAAAQPKLGFYKIKDFEINVPNIQTQKRIANILSAYDDLIQNNLKHIKLLEQAAQNIYKEWFVKLRFPGHKNTPINEETGLPEGWEEKGLCEFSSFKQYKTKIKVYEGEKEYLATANVDGIKISERGECFSFDKKPSRAQIAPPLNSVWFARMSNTDKVLCFTENTNNDIMISSGFAGFKAEEKVFLPFLFCTINNDVFSNLKDSYSTGSTQVSINNKSINSIRFIEPEIQKIKEFGEKLYPSLEMINKLFVTNKKLNAARDILLPRLMNRTIEV